MKKAGKHKSVFTWVILAVLCIYSVLLFIPLLWGLLSSLKTPLDFRLNMFGLPDKWMFSNYINALDLFYIEGAMGQGNVYLETMFLNSLLYVFGCAFFSTVAPMLMGYAVAKQSRYVLSKIIYGIVIVTMVLPIVGSMASQIQMTQALGIYDTMVGMWFLKCSFLGTGFLIFHAFFSSMSKDFAEAAYVEGANNFQVLMKIIIPMARGTFSVLFVMGIISFWNDYTTPLIYMPSKPTVALGLFIFDKSPDPELSNLPIKFCGCFIMLAPILVIFILFRNKIMGSNITMGGLKE